MSTKGSATARVLKDGRVTVPEPVREQLSLSYGDIVQIDVKPLEGAE
ncbi:bifunctional DNA-binding transcriptional regulator/antitoxin component of YhaV-PrlF toxin-antitoxin module [Halorubrum alkaliphilum]|uniref:Bifunctional DNA-binding transcriptional regulator/antitoxin component of YhaV-PrlF toxin-antitoxin module n=1 Tax=Halorubrum alkaliphilum TaxID=261290 RepID=A0A8T4GGD1_9EURY|nr:bifunctional DNA-binding transcriptional regulator/antitoxin component of YhaV-PrlF toxin-antitoxin module [Halorubrum alkaliphilum]